jgi:hypothetical protein
MEEFNALIKTIFGEERGMGIGCTGLSILVLIGIVAAVLTPRIGGYALLVGIGVAALLMLIVYGVLKKNRIANVIAGLALIIAGVCLGIFIVVDLLTSLKKGQSPMSKGVESEGYLTWVVILLATGLAMVGGGLFLLGAIKH